jgi:uncharacterized repeat protein (TIGR02543 family)
LSSGATVTLPVPPTKAGYIFSGWNTAANGLGTPFIADTAVTANITVYAQWTVKSTDKLLTDDDEVTIDSNVALNHNLTISDNQAVTVGNGATVTTGAHEVTVENDGTLEVKGTLQVDGYLDVEDGGALKIDGDVKVEGRLILYPGATLEFGANGTLEVENGGEIIATVSGTASTGTITVKNGGTYTETTADGEKRLAKEVIIQAGAAANQNGQPFIGAQGEPAAVTLEVGAISLTAAGIDLVGAEATVNAPGLGIQNGDTVTVDATSELTIATAATVGFAADTALVVEGDLLLNSGAAVAFAEDSTVEISVGGTLNIDPEAELTIAGTLEIYGELLLSSDAVAATPNFIVAAGATITLYAAAYVDTTGWNVGGTGASTFYATVLTSAEDGARLKVRESTIQGIAAGSDQTGWETCPQDSPPNDNIHNNAGLPIVIQKGDGGTYSTGLSIYTTSGTTASGWYALAGEWHDGSSHV